jgi:hypothetical protein
MIMSSRLLPGDPMPDLRLAESLTDDALGSVMSDQVRAVVLWNAGCGHCLPVIRALSALSAEHGVTCYAVAVMVQSLERAAAVAGGSPCEAIFALEEQATTPSILRRGFMTRHWLEASGQRGVPAGFIVDEANRIAWMGHPVHAGPILLQILRGEWDIHAARRERLAKVSDEAVRLEQYRVDILEASVTGEQATALALIAQAEAELRSAIDNAEFLMMKLYVLFDEPDKHDLATELYARASDFFPADIFYQLRLASAMIGRMPAHRPGLLLVVDHLNRIERQWAESGEEDEPNSRQKLLLHR